MDRRTLLSTAVSGTSFAIAGTIAVPGLITALSPILADDRKPHWQAVGPLASFPERRVVAAEAGGKPLFVWRQPRGVIAFSRACTDLGCPLTWDAGSEWFFCPCHGGVFDSEGAPVAGPPSRPMWRYATRIREGLLEVDLSSVPPMA